jgi:hypothetical protein
VLAALGGRGGGSGLREGVALVLPITYSGGDRHFLRSLLFISLLLIQNQVNDYKILVHILEKLMGWAYI